MDKKVIFSIVIRTIVNASMEHLLPLSQKDVYLSGQSPPSSPLTEVIIHGFETNDTFKRHRGATAPRIP